MVALNSNLAPGVLTSLNTGAVDGGAGERVLIDYKDAIQDYKVVDLPALSMFCEPMTTETGGDIDITFAKPSMGMQEISEGNTPKYQHTNLRSERVSVDEWGLAIGVTRRMIEDSRFNEVEMALNEARRSVDRHITKHVVYALFGVADTPLGTTAVASDTTEAVLELFANYKNGAFIGHNPATAAAGSEGRLVEYGDYSTTDLNTLGGHYIATSSSVSGANDIALVDLTTAMNLIAAKGGNANLICINPSHVKNLLDMADFTASAVANETSRAGDASVAADVLGGAGSNGIIGSLFCMNIFVNPYVPQGRFGVFDLSVKPMAYVERRPLTVEEANPGFGIVGSYMSMRYGLKVVRPSVGAICINA